MSKLYAGPLTLPAAKVRVVLAEKEIPFEFIQVAWTPAAGYTPVDPVVARVNPKKQTPVWVDDTVELYESPVICEYLEDRYPRHKLLPESAAARAACRLFVHEADTELFPAVVCHIRHLVYRVPGAEADSERATARILGFAARIERASEWRGFCFGAGPTLGDIAAYVYLRGALSIGALSRDSLNAIDGWFTRMGTRPAVKTVFDQMTADAKRLIGG